MKLLLTWWLLYHVSAKEIRVAEVTPSASRCGREKTMTRWIIFSVLLLGLLFNSGCGMAIKEVAVTAIGGTSDLLVIEPVQDLTSFEVVRISPFTSEVGGHISTELLNSLNTKIAAYNSKDTQKNIKMRELALSGEIVHVSDGTMRKQILMQLHFSDPLTEESLGLINVMGEANSIRGLSSVVDSLADSVSELLVDNHFAMGGGE